MPCVGSGGTEPTTDSEVRYHLVSSPTLDFASKFSTEQLKKIICSSTPLQETRSVRSADPGVWCPKCRSVFAPTAHWGRGALSPALAIWPMAPWPSPCPSLLAGEGSGLYVEVGRCQQVAGSWLQEVRSPPRALGPLGSGRTDAFWEGGPRR